MTPTLEEAVRDAEQLAAELTGLVTALQTIHAPFAIWDECEHEHEEGDGSTLVDEIGLTCNRLYTVCRECCLCGGAQTECCVDHHDHSAYFCRTLATAREAAVLAGALAVGAAP